MRNDFCKTKFRQFSQQHRKWLTWFKLVVNYAQFIDGE